MEALAGLFVFIQFWVPLLVSAGGSHLGYHTYKWLILNFLAYHESK